MLDSSVVSQAVRLTFEEMAFLDIADGHPIPGESVLEDSILALEYSKPTNGMLVLVLPQEIKDQAAESLYGEEASVLTSAQKDDSLLEILNVLSGRLLSARFGADVPYSMGLPSVQYDRPEAPEGWGRQEFAFRLDSWPLLLVWCEAVP